MQQSLSELVEFTVKLFQQHTDADDAHMIQMLEMAGVVPARAQELAAFVPLAFSRVLLANVAFQPNYTVIDSTTNQHVHLPVSNNEVFQGAVKFATASMKRLGGEAYYAVAGRSVEFKAINQALLNGSQLEDLILSEPVFFDERRETSRIDRP